MKKLLSIVIVVLVCAVVGNYFWTPSKAQSVKADSSLQTLKENTFSKLIDSARQGGLVRVIVGLNVSTVPEGSLRQPEAEAQRANIKQAQDNFISRFQLSRVEQVKQFKFIPFVALETDAQTLEQMRNDSQISSIEEDVLEEPTLAESTVVVGATTAWTSGFSGNGQTVAVLDTGVNKNHSFLNGKIISEACYSSNFPTANATSVCPGAVTELNTANSGLNCDTAISGCAHGTHVAGIVGGRGITFSGVAKDANIIAVQVFSRVENAPGCGTTELPCSCGTNPSPCSLSYVSDQIKGLERVRTLTQTMNIASVNMSLGGGRYTANCDTEQASRKAVIDNLRSVGVATVISSGNSGYTNSMSAPACISSAISVGSTDDGSSNTVKDAVSSFSNSVSFLSLLAPGRWINSSVANGTSTTTYQNYSGTSMSSPHVAGAFAILRQRKPDASVTQILNALASTGQPIRDTRNNISKPRIQIDAALNALSSTRRAAFDFDGDGKSDVSVFRPSNGIWYLQQSTAGFGGIQFGANGDKLVPADYDGDGKTDVAVYRNGNWYLQQSSAGFTNVSFGTIGDISVPADYDGDGKADVAVYRPSNGTWFVQRSSLGFLGFQFGSNGDKPVAADFDGDGKADFAVFRPSSGIWYVQQSTAGFGGLQFGSADDKLVVADYDGDGKADFAVYRPSSGFWYLQRSQLGFTGIQFGNSTDLPSAADYDGDGKTDVGVYRNGTWYIQQSTNGFAGISFGSPGDISAPSAFVP